MKKDAGKVIIIAFPDATIEFITELRDKLVEHTDWKNRDDYTIVFTSGDAYAIKKDELFEAWREHENTKCG